MKKISLILTLAIFPLLITAQNKAVDKLFDKYAGKDGFTTVFISKISKSMHGCGLEHLEKLEEDEK